MSEETPIPSDPFPSDRETAWLKVEEAISSKVASADLCDDHKSKNLRVRRAMLQIARAIESFEDVTLLCECDRCRTLVYGPEEAVDEDARVTADNLYAMGEYVGNIWRSIGTDGLMALLEILGAVFGSIYSAPQQVRDHVVMHLIDQSQAASKMSPARLATVLGVQMPGGRKRSKSKKPGGRGPIKPQVHDGRGPLRPLAKTKAKGKTGRS
jgi:hypothetical protein